MSRNVMIMDDSSTTRALVKRSLAMTGFSTRELFEAKNGAEGLAILTTKKVDLVLMDLNMPVMDGEVFLRSVDRQLRWSTIPFVVLSTERSPERLARILTQPTRKYLAKPFRPQALREVLQELFGAGFEEAAHA